MKSIQINAKITNAKQMQIVKERLLKEFGKVSISTILCNHNIVFDLGEADIRVERIINLIEELEFDAVIHLI